MLLETACPLSIHPSCKGPLRALSFPLELFNSDVGVSALVLVRMHKPHVPPLFAPRLAVRAYQGASSHGNGARDRSAATDLMKAAVAALSEFFGWDAALETQQPAEDARDRILKGVRRMTCRPHILLRILCLPRGTDNLFQARVFNVLAASSYPILNTLPSRADELHPAPLLCVARLRTANNRVSAFTCPSPLSGCVPAQSALLWRLPPPRLRDTCSVSPVAYPS